MWSHCGAEPPAEGTGSSMNLEVEGEVRGEKLGVEMLGTKSGWGQTSSRFSLMPSHKDASAEALGLRPGHLERKVSELGTQLCDCHCRPEGPESLT